MPCLQPPFEPNSQRKTGTNSPPAQHDAPIATVPVPRRGDRTSRRFWEGFPVLQTMGIRPAILVTSYAIRDEQGGENKSVWWINTQARFHQKQDEARLSQPSLLVAAAALVYRQRPSSMTPSTLPGPSSSCWGFVAWWVTQTFAPARSEPQPSGPRASLWPSTGLEDEEDLGSLVPHP